MLSLTLSVFPSSPPFRISAAVQNVEVDGKPVTMDVLDTAGQEEYAALQDQWIREGDGINIIFYCATAPYDFRSVRNFYPNENFVSAADHSHIIRSQVRRKGSYENAVKWVVSHFQPLP